jgi:apolipoprotein D and lipocalin family protein
MRRALALAVMLPWAAMAQDAALMVAIPGYDPAKLVGDWYEVASSPSQLEQDCYGTTAKVEMRVDGRLVLKIACHKGSLDGPVLPIEGVMVPGEPGRFDVRFVHLMELGNLALVVLWQAPDNSVAVIGNPLGAVGWVWSKSPHPDATVVDAAKQELVKVGYAARFIADVDQGK